MTWHPNSQMPCLVKSVSFSDRMFVPFTTRGYYINNENSQGLCCLKEWAKKLQKMFKKKEEKREIQNGDLIKWYRRSNKMISLIESQLNKIISASKGAKKVMLWKVILFLSSSSFSAWGDKYIIYVYIHTVKPCK